MFCKTLLIMKLAFPPPPLTMLLTGLCLILLLYKFFRVGNYCFETAFWWLTVVRPTVDGG